MLVGIILCLLAIIPLGLDGRFVSPALFPVACGTTSWLLTLGFTLAFGAMFSKIWRVHRLTTKSKADTSKTVSKNDRTLHLLLRCNITINRGGCMYVVGDTLVFHYIFR